jgi:hypothetical protein
MVSRLCTCGGAARGFMPTLILTQRMTDDSVALWRAAGRLGWNVERMNGFRPPADFKVDDQPVLYVESLTSSLFAEALGLVLSEPPLDWLPRLPIEYRLRDVSLTTLATARTLNEPRFVKPPNDKSFPAGVYLGSDLSRDYPDEAPVLVSEVVKWSVEFRCFILDRQVQTFSVYLRDGQLQREAGFPHSDQEEAELRGFVSKLLEDERVELPRATVVDVGIIDGRGWAVVEQNAAWGSGIYGCDPERVLSVLQYAVEPAAT